jgi:hypothetical protein
VGADAPSVSDDSINNRETLELVRAYTQIKNHGVRRRIYDLAKTLSITETAPEEAPDGAGESNVENPDDHGDDEA